ncbi:hypothetical protein IAR55_004293 [Kwoniella newhampshirensis]|uniref:Major facilitator superfamily (MFS) profile domain-containing protein n=1 Tax=Kwoniella newhampshirensis TaxID=1651941 RepID=A0AAW0YWX9_9TREE
MAHREAQSSSSASRSTFESTFGQRRNTLGSTPASSSSTLMDLNRPIDTHDGVRAKDHVASSRPSVTDDQDEYADHNGPEIEAVSSKYHSRNDRSNGQNVTKSGTGDNDDQHEKEDDEERKGDVVEKEEQVNEVEMIDGRPRDIYDRFTKSQKRRILAVVAFSAFIAPMTSSVFFPSIPQLSADLHTSASVINYTVAVYIVTIGIAPVVWSPFAGFYGRKPVYLASMPIMVVASIGVALSNSVGALIGTRILQGIGSSCFLSVGAGSIGDIYRPTERGRAMAAYYAGVLLGPAISPVIAGIFTEYTAASWRSTQYFLAGCGALSVLATFFFLPETSHPPLAHDRMKEEQGKKFVWYWCNPFTSLGLVRWPNIAVACFISSAGILDTYCFIVPLSSVFKERYNINNAAVAGCLFLANGAGNIVGSRIAGPWADRVVKQYIAKRGYRRPEDRLRATFLGIGILIPLSNLGYGWLLQSGKGGIAPPLVFLFINGAALMMGLSPLNTYLIDAMQSRSAEVIAANNCIRYIFAAAASAFVLPLANAIGWGWTMTLCAGIVWIATVALWLLYRYGDKWREAANARYGITKKEADEERVDKGKDEEEAISSQERSTIERASEDEKIGELKRITSTRTTRSVKRSVVGGGGGSTGGGARPTPLTRASTRTGADMPPVHEMLKRTVSLGGASVHGGG